jgi:chromosome segregation ATPase
MAPRTALREDDPPRSHERQQLALAAERQAALKKHFTAMGAALAQIHTDIHKTQRELTAAEREIELAKTANSAHRVAEALGNDSPAPPTVSDARKRCDVIKDKLIELRAAQFKLMTDEGELASQLEVANLNVRDCVKAVVRSDPVTAELVSHLEITRARFVSLDSAVLFLAANDMVPKPSPRPVSTADETEHSWRQAVAALMSGDPDYLLPFTIPK